MNKPRRPTKPLLDSYLYVYVIGAKQGPVRIGTSSLLTTTLSSLQQGNPYKLHVRHSVVVGASDAKSVRDLVRQDLEPARLENAWYDVSVAEAKIQIGGRMKTCGVTPVKDCDDIHIGPTWHRSRAWHPPKIATNQQLKKGIELVGLSRTEVPGVLGLPLSQVNRLYSKGFCAAGDRRRLRAELERRGIRFVFEPDRIDVEKA